MGCLSVEEVQEAFEVWLTAISYWGGGYWRGGDSVSVCFKLSMHIFCSHLNVREAGREEEGRLF